MGWFRLFSARFTCPQSRRRETKMRNCRFYCSHFPHCEFKLVISGIFNEEGWNDEKEDNKKRCGSCCLQLSSIHAFVRNSRGLLRVTKALNFSPIHLTIYKHVYWRTGRHFRRRCNVRAVGGDLFDIFRCHPYTFPLITHFYNLSQLLHSNFNQKKVPDVNLRDTMREFRLNLNFDKGKCLHMGWITLHESQNLTLI